MFPLDSSQPDEKNESYLCESCVAEVWNVLQMGTTSRRSFSLSSSVSRKELATRSRASSGHGCQGNRGEDVPHLHLPCDTNVPASYLEPVNGAAVDEGGKLSQSISEGVSDGTEGDDHVQVLLTAGHEEGKQGQGTELCVPVVFQGNGAHCLQRDREDKNRG